MAISCTVDTLVSGVAEMGLRAHLLRGHTLTLVHDVSGLGILGFWDSGILGFWVPGILGFLDSGVLDISSERHGPRGPWLAFSERPGKPGLDLESIKSASYLGDNGNISREMFPLLPPSLVV